MPAFAIYFLAALAEIAGCFTFWAWLRLGKSGLWLLPGMASLAIFAWLLTMVDTPAAAAPMPPMAASTSSHRSAGCGLPKAPGRIAGT